MQEGSKIKAKACKVVACAENQGAFDHLSIIAARALEGKTNSRFAILKALRSLRVYPLPIDTMEEALSLEGVGPTLAKELMKAIQISKKKAGNKAQQENTAPRAKKAVKKNSEPVIAEPSQSAKESPSRSSKRSCSGKSEAEVAVTQPLKTFHEDKTRNQIVDIWNLSPYVPRKNPESCRSKRCIDEISVESPPSSHLRNHHKEEIVKNKNKNTEIYLEIPDSPFFENRSRVQKELINTMDMVNDDDNDNDNDDDDDDNNNSNNRNDNATAHYLDLTQEDTSSCRENTNTNRQEIFVKNTNSDKLILAPQVINKSQMNTTKQTQSQSMSISLDLTQDNTTEYINPIRKRKNENFSLSMPKHLNDKNFLDLLEDENEDENENENSELIPYFDDTPNYTGKKIGTGTSIPSLSQLNILDSNSNSDSDCDLDIVPHLKHNNSKDDSVLAEINYRVKTVTTGITDVISSQMEVEERRDDYNDNNEVYDDCDGDGYNDFVPSHQSWREHSSSSSSSSSSSFSSSSFSSFSAPSFFSSSFSAPIIPKPSLTTSSSSSSSSSSFSSSSSSSSSSLPATAACTAKSRKKNQSITVSSQDDTESISILKNNSKLKEKPVKKKELPSNTRTITIKKIEECFNIDCSSDDEMSSVPFPKPVPSIFTGPILDPVPVPVPGPILDPIVDPFLGPLLGGLNDWEPVLLVDIREKDYNLIQVK